MKQRNLPKDIFFRKLERIGLAVTFDDIRIRTGYSNVLPHEVNLETRFSRNVPLKIPIVSAAMDTVTERGMAIELAKLGGIGIIHKLLDPKPQSDQVENVKYHMNALIHKVQTAYEDQTIEEILNRKKEKNWTFDTFPILNRNGTLVGVLTRNDFEFCLDSSKSAKDVMTSEGIVTAPIGTSVKRAYKIMLKAEKKMLPIVNKKGEVLGMYLWKDVKRIVQGLPSIYNVDENNQLRVGAAIGLFDDAFQRLEYLVRKNVDVVVIDTAHGDTKSVIETLKAIKRAHPDLDVVVGNISEADSARRIIRAGADGIKIGQGPGSICTTRVVAGIGTPQATAVYNCSLVAQRYNIPLCADGGIRYSGDIAVILAVGADSVMLGGTLAGTDESPGEKIFRDGNKVVHYRGMGSMSALMESKAAKERYLQKEDASKKELVPEGVEGDIPYVGSLSDVIYQQIGGLQKSMGYRGAKNLRQFQRKANFYRITGSGSAESHPHNIRITEQAPNYPTCR